MQTIYNDTDFKCHTEPGEGLTPVETSAFDGKCKAFIEGYRYVPPSAVWIREDGVEFHGEMVAPWKDYSELAAAQREWEFEQLKAENERLKAENAAKDAEKADMEAALALLGVTEEVAANG